MNGISPTSDKQAIRQEVKQRKHTLSSTEKQDYSLRICQMIENLRVFRCAKKILSYCALPDEVNIDYLLQKYASSKQFYFPRISGDDMEIVPYQDSSMQKGAFGILEPAGISADTQVDVAIIPGIAFDRKGNRSGRGKGYYDRFLTHSTACKTGVAFHCQLFDAIPVDENDIKMDIVVTEEEMLTLSSEY